MNLNDLPKQSEKLIGRVTNAVEQTGKKVANRVSNITEGKAEELTEEAIRGAVDRAIDVLQIAGEKVREKNIDGERINLEVSVNVVNVARLKITSDVPSKNDIDEVDLDLSQE